jgi:hypothetical protein
VESSTIATRGGVVLCLAVFAMAAPGLDCDPSGSSDSGAQDEGDGGVPACVDDQLAHTEGGLPILVSVPVGDMVLAVGFDDSLSDAITYWGECMDLARHCYDTTPSSASIAPCVEALPTCGGTNPATGGTGCCPAQCLRDFHAQLDAGEDLALWSTIAAGGCVAGFTAMTSAAAGVSP